MIRTVFVLFFLAVIICVTVAEKIGKLSSETALLSFAIISVLEVIVRENEPGWSLAFAVTGMLAVAELCSKTEKMS